MRNQNYTATIEVAKSPKVVFNQVNDVSKWWSKEFEGSSARLNDDFVICHTDRHYAKQKLVEVISDKKIVWLVTAITEKRPGYSSYIMLLFSQLVDSSENQHNDWFY